MAPMSVLIVDDNQPMRRAIKSLIGDLIGEFYECADGSGALTAYRRHRPDWVLMDLQVGATDGLTATRQIKADFPDARIVMLTDFDDESLRAEARRAGAWDYILKENLLAIRVLIKQKR